MENLKKLTGLLKEAGEQALWLSSEVARQYATGFHSSDGGVLITGDEGFFITDFRYIEDAGAHCRAYTVIMNTREEPVLSIIGRLLAERGLRRVLYEDRTVTCAQYEVSAKKIEAELVPLGDRLERLRAQKDDWEIERIVHAQRAAEKAYMEMLPHVRPGMTERELHAELVYRLLLCGAEELSFEPIVLSGPRTSMPHGRASDRRLEKGDFVLLDFGVKIGGYCSDMTRTFALGAANDRMRRIYDIVLRANLEGLRAARAGRHWMNEVDAEARKLISDEGFGECFGHGLGHGVGLEIHERLDGLPEFPGVGVPGAVATVEPGIYLPGEFGVRIEDMVVLRPDGCENLTRAPKELLIL